LCLVDHLEATPVLELTMRQLSVQAGDACCPDVQLAADVCLRAGRLSAEQTTTFLADRATRAAEAGFAALRVIVEMGWLLRESQMVDDLLLYESAVHQVTEQVSATVMCVYDPHCFGADLLVDLLGTHERVLLDDAELLNPQYQVGAGHATATSKELGEAQPHPAGPHSRREQPTGYGWHTLTESELRIVAHVVDGLTNREIAIRLVVSRHTVDAHLKHIYIKLGIHSRVELTVLALQQPAEGWPRAR
jgi:DNA-binding CsgD family transcriptional regulator